MADLRAIQEHLLHTRRQVEAELGLSAGPSALPAALQRQLQPSSRRAPTKQEVVEVLPTRKSRRIESLPTVDYTERTAIIPASAPAPKRARLGDVADDDSTAAGAEHRVTGPSSYNIPGEPPAGSLKTLDARVPYMNDTYLGQYVPYAIAGPGFQAKRAVVIAANASTSHTPKISAMGGIKEWRNSIFLFVNLSADSSNEFVDGGRRITWYAQDKQSEFSAQVQRLIHHATGCTYPPAEASSSSAAAAGGVFLEPCTVCLICRLDAEEPYIWCGELEYVSHEPGSHPVKFLWSLKNFEALNSTGGSSASSEASAGSGKGAQLFPQLLKAGGHK